MIYVRHHAICRYERVRKEDGNDAKEAIITAALSSTDIRRNHKKKDIIAIIYENMVLIGKEEGKDKTIFTVLEYNPNSSNWYNDEKQLDEESKVLIEKRRKLS